MLRYSNSIFVRKILFCWWPRIYPEKQSHIFVDFQFPKLQFFFFNSCPSITSKGMHRYYNSISVGNFLFYWWLRVYPKRQSHIFADFQLPNYRFFFFNSCPSITSKGMLRYSNSIFVRKFLFCWWLRVYPERQSHKFADFQTSKILRQ